MDPLAGGECSWVGLFCPGTPALEVNWGSLTHSVSSYHSPGGSEPRVVAFSSSLSPLCLRRGSLHARGPRSLEAWFCPWEGSCHQSTFLGRGGDHGVGPVPVPPSNCRGPVGGHGGLGVTAEWGLEAQGLCLGRHPPAGEVPGVPPGELT